jgi:hypothetical protein
MNGTYEIEYHSEKYQYGLDSEIVTVDGRSARQNRTPECLIEYAREQAFTRRCWRFRITQVKVKHITATKVTGMITHLIYEEELNHEEEIIKRMVVVS